MNTSEYRKAAQELNSFVAWSKRKRGITYSSRVQELYRERLEYNPWKDFQKAVEVFGSIPAQKALEALRGSIVKLEQPKRRLDPLRHYYMGVRHTTKWWNFVTLMSIILLLTSIIALYKGNNLMREQNLELREQNDLLFKILLK